MEGKLHFPYNLLLPSWFSHRCQIIPVADRGTWVEQFALCRHKTVLRAEVKTANCRSRVRDPNVAPSRHPEVTYIRINILAGSCQIFAERPDVVRDTTEHN